MTTTMTAPDGCQRWRDRRGSYRPARETIRVQDFDVASIDDDATARRFVEQHHYSGSYPAARERVGLYDWLLDSAPTSCRPMPIAMRASTGWRACSPG